MFENVQKMLAEQLDIDPEQITLQSEIVKDLGADSLDIFDLLTKLEDEFGIIFPDNEMENVKTVQDIVDMLEKLQK